MIEDNFFRRQPLMGMTRAIIKANNVEKTYTRSMARGATPMSWEKLEAVESAQAFDIRTALKVGDDWRGFFETSQTVAPGVLAFMRAQGR